MGECFLYQIATNVVMFILEFSKYLTIYCVRYTMLGSVENKETNQIFGLL